MLLSTRPSAVSSADCLTNQPKHITNSIFVAKCRWAAAAAAAGAPHQKPVPISRASERAGRGRGEGGRREKEGGRLRWRETEAPHSHSLLTQSLRHSVKTVDRRRRRRRVGGSLALLILGWLIVGGRETITTTRSHSDRHRAPSIIGHQRGERNALFLMRAPFAKFYSHVDSICKSSSSSP